MSTPLHGALFDSGMQQERTGLAWDRTGVSMMVLGAMLIRAEVESIPLVFATIGAGAVVVGTWLVVVGNRRYRRLHALLRSHADVTAPKLVLAVGLCTFVVGLATVARLLLA